MYADAWIQDSDFRDPDTQTMWDRDQLNAECEKIEKAAGIANPKDFRNEIVNYVLRYRAKNNGASPQWTECAAPSMRSKEPPVPPMRTKLMHATHTDHTLRHIIRDLVIGDRTCMLSTPRAVDVSAHDAMRIAP